MKAEINIRTVDPYNENGEWMEGDVREISNELPEIFEPDADDIEIHGSALAAIVDYVRKLGTFEPSNWSIQEETPEHGWLTATYASNVNSTQEETTVRIYDCTEAERTRAFKAITA